MTSLIKNPIETLQAQLDNLSGTTMIAVYTEGADFGGEQVFVLSVAEFKQAENNDWLDVVGEATHWQILSELNFKNGLPTYEDTEDESAPVLLMYRQGGHVQYKHFKFENLLNRDSQDFEDPLLLNQNAMAYVML